jgi:hypothetical protein
MEQFALPNLEVPFPSGTSVPEAHVMVRSLAADIIKRGAAPSEQEALHLPNESRILQVAALVHDEGHPFGLLKFL